MEYDKRTLPKLVAYIKDRRTALTLSLETARSYSGPDPSPSTTEKEQSAVDTLTGVLEAIRDIETKFAKERLAKDLDL